MVGDFSNDGILDYQVKNKINIPFYCPSFVLNSFTVKTFNSVYYHRVRSSISNQKIDIDTFFFPLDSIDHWNKIYGQNGLTQYQFLFYQKDASFLGIRRNLKRNCKIWKRILFSCSQTLWYSKSKLSIFSNERL